MSRLTSFLGCLAAAFCLAALASCSDVERIELSDETLEGAITYKGQPVPYALVIVASDNAAVSSPAASDGSYKVQNVPLGEVRIGVNTEAGRGMMMGDVMASRQGGKGPAPKFVDVPKKFQDPTTSGITTTVTEEGPNQFDIKLD